MKLMDKMAEFMKDEEGLTIVEYAVAGGLISAAAVAAFTDLGETVTGIIQGIDTALGGGGGAPPGP